MLQARDDMADRLQEAHMSFPSGQVPVRLSYVLRLKEPYIGSYFRVGKIKSVLSKGPLMVLHFLLLTS